MSDNIAPTQKFRYARLLLRYFHSVSVKLFGLKTLEHFSQYK